MTRSSLHGHQALAIIDKLGEWLDVAPFRRIVIERDEKGWHATLETRRSSGVKSQPTKGATMTDALAQAATIAAVEVER